MYIFDQYEDVLLMCVLFLFMHIDVVQLKYMLIRKNITLKNLITYFNMSLQLALVGFYVT
jgi:hypothetical protein